MNIEEIALPVCSFDPRGNYDKNFDFSVPGNDKYPGDRLVRIQN